MKIKIAKTESDFREAKRLFIEYSKSLNFSLCFQNFSDEIKILNKMYNQPVGAIFLLIQKNKFIGCVAIRKFKKNVCELKRMYIKSKFRGSGLSQKLLDYAINYSKKLRYKVMRLDTHSTMKEAINLYKKNGFKKISNKTLISNKNILYFRKSLTT